MRLLFQVTVEALKRQGYHFPITALSFGKQYNETHTVLEMNWGQLFFFQKVEEATRDMDILDLVLIDRT